MDFKPLGSRVLIKVLTRKEVTVGGIKLAVANGVNKYGKAEKEWEEDVLKAVVVKLGEDITEVEVGDVVLIPGYAGKWIDKDVVNDPETHRIVDVADILAIDLEETAKTKTPSEPVKEEANA